MMTVGEQELLSQLEEAEKEWYHAKRRIADLKNQMTDAETKLIEAKLNRDRLKEKLRIYRNTTPKYEPTKRDESIDQFREKHPELVAWAKERDLKKGENS